MFQKISDAELCLHVIKRNPYTSCIKLLNPPEVYDAGPDVLHAGTIKHRQAALRAQRMEVVSTFADGIQNVPN